MINELTIKAKTTAEENGFYFSGIDIRPDIMDIVGELSELVDAHRKNHFSKKHKEIMSKDNDEFQVLFEISCKDTFEVELADVFVRILTLCGNMNIDIDFFIRLVMRHNKLRGVRHDKNY